MQRVHHPARVRAPESNQVEGAEKTALELTGTPALQAKTHVQRAGIHHPAAAARRGGATQRTREEPRQTGQHGIPDVASTRP